MSHTCHGMFTFTSQPLQGDSQQTRNMTRLKCYACHAKRGYATFETSKSDHFCKLARGTAILPSRRLLANGCERLQTLADAKAASSRANTSQPPDPQSKTRTFRYAFGEKRTASGLSYLLAKTYGCLLPAVPHPKAGQHDSMSWSWESYQTCWRNQLMENDQPFCLANRCSPVLVSPHVWRLQVRANELKAFWGITITNFKQVILYTHCYWLQ